MGLDLSARGRRARLFRCAQMAAGAAAVAFGLFAAFVERASAQEDPLARESGASVRHAVVTVNKSRVLKFESPFASAVIGAPEVADVLPMTDSTLYIQGKKIGATNISIFDAAKKLVAVVDLEVSPDTETMNSKIRSSTGSQGIRVSSANGQIVLSGEATDAVAAARALDVAKGLADKDATIVNAMKIAETQQVMLKVRILEVDRNAGRDLGVNWQVGGSTRVLANTGTGGLSQGASIAAGQTGIGYPGTFSTTGNVNFPAALSLPTTGTTVAGTFPGGAAAATPFGALLANVINTRGVSIDVLLSALETRGLVRSLAEPDLIALSGQQASFNAGGSIPVPTLQSGNVGQGNTVSTQYANYGVQITFTPTVLNSGVIDLNMHPKVSEIDTTQPSVNGIPFLTDREANTTVELRDGQSFAVAGLLQANSSEAISQLPYLGSLPVLGSLFRSTSFQKNESELVIIVTPHLVSPASPREHLATPFDTTLQSNDIDLFLMGDLERKKKYVDYITAGGEIKGPYGYILDWK